MREKIIYPPFFAIAYSVRALPPFSSNGWSSAVDPHRTAGIERTYIHARGRWICGYPGDYETVEELDIMEFISL